MKVSRDTTSSHTISAYAPGQIRLRLGQAVTAAVTPVDGVATLSRSLIVSPTHLITDWPPQILADLQTEHWQQVLSLRPEVVLLGTGSRLAFPQPAVLSACYQAGIGVEVMDTGAACRTFNILAAEGRNVVAALLQIEPDYIHRD